MQAEKVKSCPEPFRPKNSVSAYQTEINIREIVPVFSREHALGATKAIHMPSRSMNNSAALSLRRTCGNTSATVLGGLQFLPVSDEKVEADGSDNCRCDNTQPGNRPFQTGSQKSIEKGSAEETDSSECQQFLHHRNTPLSTRTRRHFRTEFIRYISSAKSRSSRAITCSRISPAARR